MEPREVMRRTLSFLQRGLFISPGKGGTGKSKPQKKKNPADGGGERGEERE